MANLLPRILTNLSRLSLKTLHNVPKTTPSLNSLAHQAQKQHSTQATPYEIVDEEKDYKMVKDVIDQVNNQVAQAKQGRLFAVVHVAGKQVKITEGDVVIVEGYWPPECGEKLQLNKVLLAGAADFTLIGRPLVQKGLVNVEATVIEKTLSHTKTNFKKKRRKQYMRIQFYKIPQTFLRINSIQIKGEVDNPPEVEGLDKVVF
ncbi:unnamed protein product [Ceutorhynchus assimilis]|uniref:Large ribosomal subunit protein bL21m n=1 Tax=Ceutorhynchus assimilis TaxID=467358 RepID=A0A9N9QAD6_9CUCU|nr:unnamed protein product [Ceutorhynchus assimilis]